MAKALTNLPKLKRSHVSTQDAHLTYVSKAAHYLYLTVGQIHMPAMLSAHVGMKPCSACGSGFNSAFVANAQD